MYIKFFRIRKIFRIQVFAGFALQSFNFVFKITITEMHNVCCRLVFYQNLFTNRLLTSAFVLVNGIVFGRSNGLIQ